MRVASIVVLAIGVCGVKDESAEQDSDASEAPAPASVNEDEPVQPPAKPPKPEVPGLDAALARAIVEEEDGRFRVDPFVATLVAEALEETGGEPIFRRIAKRQIKAGVPAGFRVGRIEKGSLFHRLGLRQGDIVTKVGTAAPPLPKRLKKLLETIEGEVDVEVLRDGRSIALHYELADDQSWHDYLAKTAGRTFTAEEPEPEPEPEPDEVADASTPGGKPIEGGGTHSGSGSSSSSGKPTGGGGSSSSGTPASIPVSCSSSSSCTVAKWYFDKVVSSSSQMRSQAKISSASGGYKLAWVKPGSGVSKLQFRSGDIITRVNGRNLSNQLEALSLYAGLKSTRTYKVNYTRGGRSLTKTIRIV